jgi:hypothetical protein
MNLVSVREYDNYGYEIARKIPINTNALKEDFVKKFPEVLRINIANWGESKFSTRELNLLRANIAMNRKRYSIGISYYKIIRIVFNRDFRFNLTYKRKLFKYIITLAKKYGWKLDRTISFLKERKYYID